MKIRYAAMSVLATVVVAFGATFAFGNPIATLAPEPVQTCVAPTGTMTVAKHYAYDKCMHERTQALVRNGYEPAPTVTETVTASPTSTATATPTTTAPSRPPRRRRPLRRRLRPACPRLRTSPPPPALVPGITGPEPTAVYAGGCYFSNSTPLADRVVENKVVNCQADGLRFAPDTTGWVFRNSILNGGMFTVDQTLGDPGADDFPKTPLFTVEDSDIIDAPGGAQDRAACCGSYTIKRSYLRGTHSGLLGHNNTTLIGNFITTDGTDTHQSGVRVLKNAVIRDNTITCFPVAAGYEGSGCSGHGVFYREAIGGQNVPATNLTIEHNYWKRHSTGGPYAATRWIDCAIHSDCTNIKFTGNLFSLGEGTDAGEFPLSSAGNVWSGNYWTDGQVALSGQSR